MGALAVALSVGGCAGSGDGTGAAAEGAASSTSASPSTPVHRVDVDPDALRLVGTDSQYRVEQSVGDAMASVGYTVAGTVAGWVEGTQVLEPSAVKGFDRDSTALMAIDVTGSFGTEDAPSTVYLEVPRGTDRVDAAGEQIPLGKHQRYNVLTLDQLAQGAPAGARVLVIGEKAPAVPAPDADGGSVVPADVPDGATVLQAIGQGFWLEDADGSLVNGRLDPDDAFVGSWPGATTGGTATFDELLDAVRAASGS